MKHILAVLKRQRKIERFGQREKTFFSILFDSTWSVMLESMRLCQTNGHLFRELEAEKEDGRDTVALLTCRICFRVASANSVCPFFREWEREKCDLRNM